MGCMQMRDLAVSRSVTHIKRSRACGFHEIKGIENIYIQARFPNEVVT